MTNSPSKREQLRTTFFGPDAVLLSPGSPILYPKHGMYPQDIHEGHPTSWKLGPQKGKIKNGRVGAKGSDT